MKYFRREIHEAFQWPLDTPEGAEGILRWKAAHDTYREHLKLIRPSLPPSIERLLRVCLHDTIVREAEREPSGQIKLVLEGRDGEWGEVGLFSITFIGVVECETAADLIGQRWMYEEVHLHPSAAFEYRVFFDRSDFRVAAMDVNFIANTRVDDTMLYHLAQEAMKAGDYEKAVTLFGESAEIRPQFKTLELLGETFLLMGEPKRAITLLAEEFIALGDANAIEFAQEAVRRMPHYGRAKAALDAALQLER